MSDIIRVDEGLLHEVKEYCRIDELGWEESTMILALVESAISELAIAGVNMPEHGTLFYAQYKLLLFAMVFDSWENRGTQAAGVTLSENPAFRRRLNQLKLAQQSNVPVMSGPFPSEEI